MSARKPELEQLVLGLAAAYGGTTNAAVAAALRKPTQYGAALVARFVNRGLLFRAKQGRAARYFSSQEAAEAWVNRPQQAKGAWELHLPGTPRLRSFAPAKPAEARPPTRGPDWTHDPRYQCSPGAQPFGAGFAAAGVGFDVTTGKPWGSCR